MDDHALLRRYAEGQSEEAFHQLVERHGGMVYAAALRQLRQPHRAEEVTHAVFIALAQKAGRLSRGIVLVGWLFKAARFAAAKLQRDEERRTRRQQEAAIMHATLASNDEDQAIWDEIRPCLNDALDALADKDRNAVLLRFFENLSFTEVGGVMGTSEDAAKMRVGRALEKLRGHFKKRGVVLTALALTGALSLQASAAPVPVAVARSVAGAVITNGADGAGSARLLAKAVLRGFKLAKLKLLMVIAAGMAVLLLCSWIAGRAAGWWGGNPRAIRQWNNAAWPNQQQPWAPANQPARPAGR